MPIFSGEHYGIQAIDRTDEMIILFNRIREAKPIDCTTIGLFYTLLGIIIPRMTPDAKDKRSATVSAAKKFISEHPHASVSNIAKACAVSESTLYAAFKATSELSLNEYKGYVIMERAKELLISTDTPIEKISSDLKFSSAAYFRKCFIKQFNMTPREMRKKFKI